MNDGEGGRLNFRVMRWRGIAMRNEVKNENERRKKWGWRGSRRGQSLPPLRARERRAARAQLRSLEPTSQWTAGSQERRSGYA